MGYKLGRVIATDARPSPLYALFGHLLVVLFCLFCLICPIAVIGVAFDVQPPFSLYWAGSVLLFLEGTLFILAAALSYSFISTAIMSILVFVESGLWYNEDYVNLIFATWMSFGRGNEIGMSAKETVKKYTETLIQMTGNFCDQHLNWEVKSRKIARLCRITWL